MDQNNFPFLSVAKWIFLLLLLTPFVVDKGMFFPYVEIKTVYLRAISAFALLFFAIFLIASKRNTKIQFLEVKARLLEHPISLAFLFFFFSALLSTALAQGRYRAIFGTVERGEGLIGIFFFVSIFFLALFLLEEKEWRIFWIIAAVSGAILSVNAFMQFIKTEGVIRSTATLGNPAFLAGYLLFAISAAMIALAEFYRKRILQKSYIIAATIVSFIIILACVVTIVVFTQSRGSILGLGGGLVVAGVYLLSFARHLRKYVLGATVALVLLGLAGAVSILLWAQQVDPGRDESAAQSILRRFVSAGAFQTRFIAAKVSLDSVNPANEGLAKFLFGWGLDNFGVAYNKHFDPEYFKYENVWFDRAHNKIFDALVMQGIIGLFAYLAVWGVAVYAILRRKTEQFADRFIFAAALFVIVAYFIHDLFLFDTPASSVILFSFFAFIVFQTKSRVLPKAENQNADNNAKERTTTRFLPTGSVFFALIALILFLWATWLPYRQMKEYIKLKTSWKTLPEFTAGLDRVLHPYTYAQDRIRIDLVKSVDAFPADEDRDVLITKIFKAADELVKQDSYEPRHAMNTGIFLEAIGDIKGAEGYLRQALELAPKRIDLLYLLGQNLLQQGRIDEGRDVLKQMVQIAPDVPIAKMFFAIAIANTPEEYGDKTMEVFDLLEDVLGQSKKEFHLINVLSLGQSELEVLRGVYETFLLRFYIHQDEENFLKALRTAIMLEERYERSQENLFKEGKIPELPPKRSEDYKKALEVFPTMGWDAIGVQAGE